MRLQDPLRGPSEALGAAWRVQAPCRGLDPRIFVPAAKHGRKYPPPIVVAVCPSCPVRRECEEAGRASGSSGWWGGRYITGRGER